MNNKPIKIKKTMVFGLPKQNPDDKEVMIWHDVRMTFGEFKKARKMLDLNKKYQERRGVWVISLFDAKGNLLYSEDTSEVSTEIGKGYQFDFLNYKNKTGLWTTKVKFEFMEHLESEDLIIKKSDLDFMSKKIIELQEENAKLKKQLGRTENETI